MSRSEIAYKKTMYAFFALNCVFALFVIVACCFPFLNGETFFKAYKGVLYEKAEDVQPYIVLTLPFLSALCSFFASRTKTAEPGSYLRAMTFIVGALIGRLSFLFIVYIKPLSYAASIGLSAGSFNELAEAAPEGYFGPGFYMVSYASYMIIIDLSAVLGLLALFIVKKRREKKAYLA